MKLYHSRPSGNCYKVRLLLSQLRRDFEVIEIDVVNRANRAKEMPADAPSLRVPLLQLDDGRYLPESNAILCYLARETELFPPEPFANAQVLRWLFFEQNHIEPNVAVARYMLTISKTGLERPEVIEHLQAGAVDALRRVDDQLKKTPFICGESYTIADIALFGYSPMAGDSGIDMEPYKAIAEWIKRVEGQPGWVPR